jgi:hypothetical protein
LHAPERGVEFAAEIPFETRMNPAANPDPKYQDARALPAPPAALWTFGVLLTVSALWAIFHG